MENATKRNRNECLFYCRSICTMRVCEEAIFHCSNSTSCSIQLARKHLLLLNVLHTSKAQTTKQPNTMAMHGLTAGILLRRQFFTIRARDPKIYCTFSYFSRAISLSRSHCLAIDGVPHVAMKLANGWMHRQQL